MSICFTIVDLFCQQILVFFCEVPSNQDQSPRPGNVANSLVNDGNIHVQCNIF